MLSVCIIVISHICATVFSDINSNPPIISIKTGQLQGRLAQTISEKRPYFAFQGIPYAEPPIGELRFEPPVPKQPWNGILKATEDGTECVQIGAPDQGSEDCLFVNVYVPKKVLDSKALSPVLVWIYGGGFTVGNSSYDQWGPDFLLEKGIIVVTFNYRLNIFGFFTTKDLVVPGNNGLKDQQLALKWVQKNIQSFGGDPDKVTLAGQSAGSASVSFQLLSKKSQGLFRSAIMESGVALSEWTLYRDHEVERLNKRLAQLLKINSTNSQDFVNKLRKVDKEKLRLSAYEAMSIIYLTYDQKNGVIFGPTIEPKHKNAFISESSYSLLSSGKYLKVPCILGFNSLEMGNFLPNVIPAQVFNLWYDVDNTRLIPYDMNVGVFKKRTVSSLIKNYYFSGGSISFSGLPLQEYLSDEYFVRSTAKFVYFMQKNVPVYFYRFAYQGHLGLANRQFPGVVHQEEVNYIWNVKDAPSATFQDLKIRYRLIDLWTNFVKYLNPSDSMSSGLIWPKSNENLTYLDIDNKSTIRQLSEEHSIRFWDKLYRTYDHGPFSTY